MKTERKFHAEGTAHVKAGNCKQLSITGLWSEEWQKWRLEEYRQFLKGLVILTEDLDSIQKAIDKSLKGLKQESIIKYSV